MLASDHGRTVTKKYLVVAKSMREYEEQLYVQWCQNVENNSLQYLKAHILTKESVSVSQPVVQISTPGSAPSAAVVERVVVNLKPEIREIIKETKHLDKMGFQVPESALNVALQENKYYSYVENLNTMLTSYSNILDILDPIERKLLSSQITDLKRAMSPGLTRLNWNSLGIAEFTVKCNQEINKFSSLVNQIRKNSSNIEHVIAAISSSMLIKEPEENDIQDAFVF